MGKSAVSSRFAAAALGFLGFFFALSAAEPSFSFSFGDFGKDPSFDSDLALYGAAKVVNGGSSVQLTESLSFSTGRVMYNRPIKLFEGKTQSSASFSTYFSFSMSHEHGGGLAFVMLPSPHENSSLGFPRELVKDQTEAISVEFDTSGNSSNGDFSENHLAVVLNGSVAQKISNLSSDNLLLNGVGGLHSWIDYEASSKRLEVRISKSSHLKPVDPLISYTMDLSKMSDDKGMFVGLRSSNGNSSQTCYLISWRFNLRSFPHWMHSYPIDPKNAKHQTVLKKKDVILQVLTCFVTTFGSTALLFFAVLYLLTMCRRRSLMMVVPEECGLKTKDFEYKKVEMVVDKANQGCGKN